MRAVDVRSEELIYFWPQHTFTLIAHTTREHASNCSQIAAQLQLIKGLFTSNQVKAKHDDDFTRAKAWQDVQEYIPRWPGDLGSLY